MSAQCRPKKVYACCFDCPEYKSLTAWLVFAFFSTNLFTIEHGSAARTQHTGFRVLPKRTAWDESWHINASAALGSQSTGVDHTSSHFILSCMDFHKDSSIMIHLRLWNCCRSRMQRSLEHCRRRWKLSRRRASRQLRLMAERCRSRKQLRRPCWARSRSCRAPLLFWKRHSVGLHATLNENHPHSPVQLNVHRFATSVFCAHKAMQVYCPKDVTTGSDMGWSR